jgi:hypothetical protein
MIAARISRNSGAPSMMKSFTGGLFGASQIYLAHINLFYQQKAVQPVRVGLLRTNEAGLRSRCSKKSLVCSI